MINRLLLISMIWLVTDVAAKEIYVDVGKSAGINFTHHNGAEGNRILFETMGAGTAFFDYDNDNYLDLYIVSSANTSGNILMRNNGDGTFSDVTDAAGVGNTDFGMGVCVADYDNDGLLDIFLTNFDFETNTLYRNFGNGFFGDITAMAGLAADDHPYMGWSTGFVDFDNDGHKDVFITNGHIQDNIQQFTDATHYKQRDQLFRNRGDGRFSSVSNWALVPENTGRGATFGDYDNDGDVDIFIVNNNHPATLLRNDTGNSHHWLILRTIGTRSNRDGIGARVELVAGNTSLVEEVRSGAGYLSGRDSRVHFGLGSHSYVDRLTVKWPSGILQEMKNVPSNQVLVITEPAN